VSAYPIATTTALSADVPAGDSYIVAIGVSWETSSGTSPDSTSPITMTITDPNIKAGDTIYELTSTGLVAVGTATVDGSATVAFSSDPTFLVTAKLVAQATLSVTAPKGTVGKGDALTSSGGSGTGAVTYAVTNGTAKGCAIANGELTAASAGTCLVTATKALDGTYSATTSTATTVAFVLPARPGAVSVSFSGSSSVLSVSGRRALTALAKKLVAGASVTITGYAGGDKQLATARASAVRQYLATRVKVHVTLVASHAASDKVVISTSKQ
jgi:outer membrane protein OmpA-like peptidoglycan-associated protein